MKLRAFLETVNINKMFDRQKKKLKYEQVLDSAVEACLEYARDYDTSRLMNQVPAQAQPELLRRFTHLKVADPAFFESRREIYRKIFDDAFKVNGTVISPEPSKQKKRFILVGTYFRGKWDMLDLLLKKDKSLPSSLQAAFDRVNNGHAIQINLMRVMNQLPEFQEALKNKHPYPESIVGGEVAAICRSMINTAKICGYNIVDISGSHTQSKSDATINIMKGIQHYYDDTQDTSKEEVYKLYSAGVTGEAKLVLDQKEDYTRYTEPKAVTRKMAHAMKDMAEKHSFRRLMGNSTGAFLVWDSGENAKDRFTLAARVKDGELKIYDESKWNIFKSHKYLLVNASEELEQSFSNNFASSVRKRLSARPEKTHKDDKKTTWVERSEESKESETERQK